MPASLWKVKKGEEMKKPKPREWPKDKILPHKQKCRPGDFRVNHKTESVDAWCIYYCTKPVILKDGKRLYKVYQLAWHKAIAEMKLHLGVWVDNNKI